MERRCFTPIRSMLAPALFQSRIVFPAATCMLSAFLSTLNLIGLASIMTSKDLRVILLAKTTIKRNQYEGKQNARI